MYVENSYYKNYLVNPFQRNRRVAILPIRSYVQRDGIENATPKMQPDHAVTWEFFLQDTTHIWYVGESIVLCAIQLNFIRVNRPWFNFTGPNLIFSDMEMQNSEY